MSRKYNSTVIPINCAELNISDITNIFSKILYEFPVSQVNFSFPKWVNGLDFSHPLKQELFNSIENAFNDISLLKDTTTCSSMISSTNIITKTQIDNIDLGTGKVNISITLKESLFYQVLTQMTGVEITDEGDLFTIINSLSKTQKKYNKIAEALDEVDRKGYGIVTPSIDELVLAEPEMVKQGSRFGVKLKATAPSLHIIKANIETEVSPIVGSEKQSEELVNYLLSGFESDPQKIWNSNIFGKSLHELVNEGLQTKLAKMPEEAKVKLKETLERIVNEGSGGLICIIL